MKTSHYLVLLVSLAAPAAALGIDSTNSAGGASSRMDYVSFRVISERNIFNPRRSGRSTARTTTRTEPERRVRTERFALLGTMSYEKGRYAFFDLQAETYWGGFISGDRSFTISYDYVIRYSDGTTAPGLTLGQVLGGS